MLSNVHLKIKIKNCGIIASGRVSKKLKDQNCAYCMEGELVGAFGIKICELESSKVYLFKEQSHPGRVIVAHKKHVSEITELTAQERASYMEDINRVACAMHEIFISI